MDDFRCMLAQKFEEKRLTFPCLVSPKLDGIRAQFYQGKFYTRNKKLVKGMGHLEEILKPLAGQEIWLDGELMVPGIPFQKSSGLIRSFNDTPEAEFFVFDAPYYVRPQQVRIQYLREVFEKFKLDKPLNLVPHEFAKTATFVYGAYKAYRGMGYEGAMVKHLDGKYVNCRSYSWLKMKELETYDVQCVGFFEGNGRLAGSLGGIIVDLDSVAVRVGGGFSDSERDYIWANPDEFLGLVCEVAAQEVTPDGSLRHPRFLTWRDDIDAIA